MVVEYTSAQIIALLVYKFGYQVYKKLENGSLLLVKKANIGTYEVRFYLDKTYGFECYLGDYFVEQHLKYTGWSKIVR